MSVSPVARAQQRAFRIYPRNKGFRSAYVAGAQAALAGRPIDRCPYQVDPGKTWRSAWRRAWTRGWLSVPSDRPLG